MYSKISFIFLICISFTFNAHSNSKWLQDNARSSLRSKMPNVNVFMADKPCPTRYHWFTNIALEDEYYVKWKNLMIQRLDGFPETTIKKCTEKKYLIKNGNIIDHPVHSSNLARLSSTMLWEKEGKKFPLRIILESNIRNKKPEGIIYNEKLEKICTTYSKRSYNSTKVKITCTGLPEPINAIAKIIDKRTGKFKVFGEGGGYKIFVTNLTLKNAQKKFPEIFNK
jgi:hypothetical protein